MESAVVEEIEIPEPETQHELPDWCERTEVSLTIKKKKISFDEWADLIHQLKLLDKSRQWLLGDALVEGSGRFGEDSNQVIDPDEELERDEEGNGETFRQYQQVAERIPSGSRLPTLSWGHHQAVAYLEPDRRDYWLRRAHAEGLKRNDLRRAVRKEKAKQERAKGTRKGDLECLQSPEAQEWLQGLHTAVLPYVDNAPEGAVFLRALARSVDGAILWQADRTVEADCKAIMDLFEADKENAPYSATDIEIFKWLQARFKFMSDPDLDERLEHLCTTKRLKYVATGGRKDGQKGEVTWSYMPFNQHVIDERPSDRA